MNHEKDNSIIINQSCYTVPETIKILKKTIEDKNIKIFGIIDHFENAKSINMELNDSKLIIFANPSLGTILMKQDMTVGLDLPLHILIYKDFDKQVKIAYRDGSWLNSIHNFDSPQIVEKMNAIMKDIVSNISNDK